MKKINTPEYQVPCYLQWSEQQKTKALRKKFEKKNIFVSNLTYRIDCKIKNNDNLIVHTIADSFKL